MTISYKKWNSTTTGSDGKDVTSLACIQKKIDGVGVCMIPLDDNNLDDSSIFSPAFSLIWRKLMKNPEDYSNTQI